MQIISERNYKSRKDIKSQKIREFAEYRISYVYKQTKTVDKWMCQEYDKAVNYTMQTVKALFF